MGRKIWATDQNYFFLLLIAITAPTATTNITMVIVIYMRRTDSINGALYSLAIAGMEITLTVSDPALAT